MIEVEMNMLLQVISCLISCPCMFRGETRWCFAALGLHLLTFMHLAFIRSDVKCIQAVCFITTCIPRKLNHDLVLLASRL